MPVSRHCVVVLVVSVCVSGIVCASDAPKDLEPGAWAAISARLEADGVFTKRGKSLGDDVWEVEKLSASDGGSLDNFGGAVSISGDTVVVGAPNAEGNVDLSGCAYVFDRNAGGPEAWGEVTKLLASDGSYGEYFGLSIAISGDTVVVGAPGADDNGSAYVFERDLGGPDAWGEVTELRDPDGAIFESFGWSVSISGDTIVVGSTLDDSSGSACIFYRNQGGANAWGLVTKVRASDGAVDDSFGSSVSIDDDTMVVGAYGNDDSGSYSGSAYVFERDLGGPDAWGERTKLLASNGAADDNFGLAVSIDGDTIVVGAPWKSGGVGSVYVFGRNLGGDDAWGEAAGLSASDGAPLDRFGFSVSIAGDTVLVGAMAGDGHGIDSGAAYVYERNLGGADAWGEMTKLVASDGASDDSFGHRISVSGDSIVVGAQSDDDSGDQSGSAYVFNFGLFGDGFESGTMDDWDTAGP